MLSDLYTKKLTRCFQVCDIDDDGCIAAADFERIVENVRITGIARNRAASVTRT
jgi:Ca2+-binding EF-hand superfamily protein